MSDLNPVGGGRGGNGYITDPPLPPGPGDRLLSDPPLAPGPGDRLLGAPPAAPTPGDHFITDAPALAPGERFITDAPALAPGQRFITDPPPPPAPGDRPLATAAHGAPVEAPPRKEPTAGDHALRSLNNVGNFFEDLWDKNYGEAVLDAGNAVMDAGSVFHALLFGDDEKNKPPVK